MSTPRRGSVGPATSHARFSSRRAGGKQNTGSVQLTYKFAAQPNRGQELGRPNIVIDGTTVTKKHGWEYLDVRYETVETQVYERGPTFTRQAAIVKVHQVFEFGDFSALLIGN